MSREKLNGEHGAVRDVGALEIYPRSWTDVRYNSIRYSLAGTVGPIRLWN